MSSTLQGSPISLSMKTKMGVAGIRCVFLASFLCVLLSPSLVVAEIMSCFYKNPSACISAANCCTKMKTYQCCNAKDGYGYSAYISVNVEGYQGEVYLKQNCNGIVAGRPESDTCLRGRNLTIYHSSKAVRIKRLESVEQPCNQMVSVDTLRYTFITEDEKRAHLVLSLANLTETDSDGPSQYLPPKEQVNWFKARGAVLEVDDHNITVVPGYTAISAAAAPRLPHPVDVNGSKGN
jgi:hypothetical protein